MSDSVGRDEFKALEARVSVVEREVEGEKMVSRYNLEQSRRNGDDLAGVVKRLDRLEGKHDRLEGKHDRLEGKFDRLEGKFDALVSNLPRIVADSVREVLREGKV